MEEILELSYKKPYKYKEMVKFVVCSLCGMNSTVMYRYKFNGVNGRLCFNCYHSRPGAKWKK